MANKILDAGFGRQFLVAAFNDAEWLPGLAVFDMSLR